MAKASRQSKQFYARVSCNGAAQLIIRPGLVATSVRSAAFWGQIELGNLLLK
jgi:hypothetical protein